MEGDHYSNNMRGDSLLMQGVYQSQQNQGRVLHSFWKQTSVALRVKMSQKHVFNKYFSNKWAKSPLLEMQECVVKENNLDLFRI